MGKKIMLLAVIFSLGFLTSQFLFVRPLVVTQPPQSNEVSSLGSAQVLSEQTDDSFLVTRVIDGDTIEIEGGKKVRYIGIDTPESVDPRKPVECYGREASSENKRLVEGKAVRLEKDVSETDQYGRLLRYVYVDGVLVNEYLVRQGFAYAPTYPPDVKFQDLFRQAETEARETNHGLWGGCSPQLSPTMKQLSNPPAGEAGETIVPKADRDVKQGCAIKGNISSSGEKIYHLPGCGSYEKTSIDEDRGERWFCTEEEAVSAGWRKAKNC